MKTRARESVQVGRLDPRALVAMPWAFAEIYLGHTDNYDWVKRIMADVCGRPGEKKQTFTTALCNNESGKTTRVLAALATWHASVFAYSTTVLTSGVFRQVRQQLFPAIERLKATVDFRDWEFKGAEIITPRGSRILGIRPVDPNYFEGYHGRWPGEKRDEGPLMIAADEGKGIKPPIFHRIEERCNPQRTLYVSSAGGPFGYFYDTHEKPAFRDLYQRHRVSCEDCPHIPRESIERRIQKWGRNHPLVKGPLFSEWMLEPGDEFIVPLSAWENSLRNPPEWRRDGVIVAYVDFGQGVAETVLTILNGNKVLQISWKEDDEVKTCQRLVELFIKYRLRPEQIGGDGGSKAMISIVRNMGWPIRGINNQDTARDSLSYSNVAAEMWFEGAMAVRKSELLLPDDEVLKLQATTRKQEWDGRGRLKAQSKEDMAEDDGLESPDRADSLFGALWMRGGRFETPPEAGEREHHVYASKGAPFEGGRRREEDEEEHAHEPAIAGMEVGE